MSEAKLGDIRAVPTVEMTEDEIGRAIREAESYLGPLAVTPAMRQAIRDRRVKVVQGSNSSLAGNDCEGGGSGCCTVTLYTTHASVDLGCGPLCE